MKGCEYSASDYSFAWPEYQSSIMLTHINLQSDSQEKEAQEKMKISRPPTSPSTS